MIRQRILLPAPARRAIRLRSSALADPCVGCPLESAVKVWPTLPASPRIVAVGLGPGRAEEARGVPFIGPAGALLRSALASAGLDAAVDVGYANLTRCRPPGDAFDSPEWVEAQRRCWTYLSRDLASWHGPLLLLGTRPLAIFTGNAKARVTQSRGLWLRLPDGGQAFAARHPASILRTQGVARSVLEAQLRVDLKHMAARLFGTESFPPVKVLAAFPSPNAAAKALAKAGVLPRFYFDIETMDAAGSPARKDVAVDPYHPDFRVRGVAVAVGPLAGFYVDLAGWEGRKEEAQGFLDRAFGSEAEKGAFFGHFDEAGLKVGGWVTSVANRARDPFLAAVALDASGMGHSLERLAVDVLGEPQPKAGVDRSRIAEMTLAEVAEYAVKDACLEWRLDDVLRARLEAGEYF